MINHVFSRDFYSRMVLFTCRILIGSIVRYGVTCKLKALSGLTEVSIFRHSRGEWGKAPMWGRGPTTEITFMDGNTGNICTCALSYVIGLPGRAVADGENTS